MAGQITVWNRVMSLPITWRSAGHHFSNSAAIPAEPDRGGIVDQRIEPHVDDARRDPTAAGCPMTAPRG